MCVVRYSVCVRCVMLVVKERAILAGIAERFEMRSGGAYSTSERRAESGGTRVSFVRDPQTRLFIASFSWLPVPSAHQCIPICMK